MSINRLLKRIGLRESPSEKIEREKQERDNKLLKLTLNNPEFGRFEGSFREKYGIEYQRQLYPTYFSYLSSLCLVDMLEKGFTKGKIRMPKRLTALDIGAGEWGYVIPLLRFLENYGDRRTVSLLGIDYHGAEHLDSVKQRTQNLQVEYRSGDIMDVPKDETFNFAFMAHMPFGEYHCKAWKVPYVGPKRLFRSIDKILKPHGLLVVAAYINAGEETLIDYIPEKKKDC